MSDVVSEDKPRPNQMSWAQSNLRRDTTLVALPSGIKEEAVAISALLRNYSIPLNHVRYCHKAIFSAARARRPHYRGWQGQRQVFVHLSLRQSSLLSGVMQAHVARMQYLWCFGEYWPSCPVEQAG
jgi:hypothetical protein